MRLIRSIGLFSILVVDALAAALPASDAQYISHKAIAKRTNPTIGGKILVKRAEPTIGDGIDVNDPQRGGKLVPRPDFPTSGAFSNALQLMIYATTLPGSTNDAVFRKYFNEEDKLSSICKRMGCATLLKAWLVKHDKRSAYADTTL